MQSPSSISHRLFVLSARPIVVASHRRSGTHLMIDLLRKQFPDTRIRKNLGQPLHHLYLTLESFRTPNNPAGLDDDRALRIASRAPRPIVKTHMILDDIPTGPRTTPDHLGEYWMRWLRDHATFIYVYRDPRDVLSSLHLYMQAFDPSTRISFSQFIRQNDNFSPQHLPRPAAWAQHVNRWLNHPRVIAVSYENIIHKTQQTLQQLAQTLGQTPQMIHPLLPVKPANIWQMRWQRFFSHHPQNTAIVGSYKGRKLVNWRTQLSPDDRKFFHDQAGDTLIRLGYESSDSWITAPSPLGRGQG